MSIFYAVTFSSSMLSVAVVHAGDQAEDLNSDAAPKRQEKGVHAICARSLISFGTHFSPELWGSC
jgi:hypothetical protein